ncbi:MAG: ATP-dependent DNA helicase [Thermoplasmata archaeon]|nr:ATP-dependent DNA helicase [Thermoplasmata archaeon]
MRVRVVGETTASAEVPIVTPHLFPYRVRAGQERILESVRELGHTGGALLIDAATGSGKTVATLAPLLEHAEAADHKVLYLVRTHAQENQVLTEAKAISHRLDKPLLAIGLQGRQRRCFLLENVVDMKGATAEEHGKLCADRKRATESSLSGGVPLEPPTEIPEGQTVELNDLDGCPYYARVLQSDMDALTERFAAKPASPREFEAYCRGENLCPYELSKKLAAKARLVTAPYAFFFHPHIRPSLLNWMGVTADRVDLVIDEAHNLPDHLRDLASVSLARESIRRARTELIDHGDFQLPDGPGAVRLMEVFGQALDELAGKLGNEEEAILPPNALEDLSLAAIGGTSHRLDTWLGALVAWGEALREERRKNRMLPRSWVHTVALALLSWPQLEEPSYVKVITQRPRAAALEAYALSAEASAQPILTCHLSVHLSGTLAPLEEYRDALGLGDGAKLLSVPSTFPPEHRRFLYDPEVTTRYEDLKNDPTAISRIADRLADVLRALPVKTAVFFPSFDMMERVLEAGLKSELPAPAVIENRWLSMSDLWRSVEGFKKEPGGGVLLGVTGGRIAEGVDFPDEELEAVVVVGIPYPKPTAKREALRRFYDATNGHGWEYCVEAPAQRAILQAFGRMIRSENDRGIGILLDRRAPTFAARLPGLVPIEDLTETARRFYGRRTPWAKGVRLRTSTPGTSGGAAQG